MHYIIEEKVMQIMNLDKQVKNLVSFFSASNIVKDFPDAVILTDFNGYIIEANKKAAQCFELTNESTVAVKIDDVIKNAADIINSSCRQKRPVLGLADVNGKNFYIELNATRTSKGFCISVRDISQLTDETVLANKIERFNGEKNVMLYKLKSEILSPLSSVIGFSKGLLDGIGGDLTEKQAKYIRIINNNADNLQEFVENLLEFSYSESSLFDTEYRQFDIISLIKEVIAEFNKIVEEKGLNLTFDYEMIDKRTIYSDLKAVKRILTNILQIAISTTESGTISINISHPTGEDFMMYSLNEERKYLRITFKDSSSGWSAQELQTMCDPYLQLDKNNRKSVLQAFKLGTASILTKRLQGAFDITSEFSNGSLYSIIIPAEKDSNE